MTGRIGKFDKDDIPDEIRKSVQVNSTQYISVEQHIDAN